MTTLNLVQPDITLFLNPEGVIQDLNLSDSIFDAGIAHAWRGQHWFNTVSNAEVDQVRRLVEDVLATGVSATRRIVQSFPNGREIPVEYTTVRLGADAGLIAIGRSYQAVTDLQSDLVAARQSMEQEVWKLRTIETRYRLLFDTAVDPVLVLDAETLKITEANPTAMQALGIARGGDFVGRLAASEQAPLKALLARARQEGSTPSLFVHVGPAREAWIVRASMDRDTSGAGYLLQLTPSLPGREPARREPGQHEPGQHEHGHADNGAVATILADIQSKTWNLDETSMLEAVSSATGIVEQHFIMATLKKVAGNKKAAAELLGVSRQSFYTKFKRYGLKRP